MGTQLKIRLDEKIKKRVMFVSVTTLILLTILHGPNIAKQFIKTFGKSENITIYTKSISPIYYKPYYDKFYIDLYSDNTFTDTYIYGVKIDNHQNGEIGDTVVVRAKLYKLGNKFTLEYTDCFYNTK